jgi:predicted DNA-binding protein
MTVLKEPIDEVQEFFTTLPVPSLPITWPMVKTFGWPLGRWTSGGPSYNMAIICYLGRMTRRTQTLVQLNEDLVARLDEVAANRRLSRSGLIREILESALAEQERDRLSERIIKGYTEVPQSDARDEWGDLDAWTETLARRNLAALRADEDERW